MRSPRSSIAPVLVATVLVLALLLVSPEEVAAGTPVKGQIVADTTWTLAGSPYWVEGNVVVLHTANLTIEPGVRVLFDGLFAIYVEGEIFAVGSSTSVISFTSNLSKPSPGVWRGLQVNATGRALIRHTDVTYALNGVRIDGSSSNLVSQSHIAHNLEAGISVVNESAGDRIEENSIQSSDNGVYINGGSHTVISGNNISFNDIGVNCHDLGCQYATIAENEMHMNAYHAVRMDGARNIIHNNSMTGNGYGGERWDSHQCYDASLYNEEPPSAIFSIGWMNEYADNYIAYTSGVGLVVDCGGVADIERNTVRGNKKGIYILGSPTNIDPGPDVHAERNLIIENQVGVEILHGRRGGGTFYYNVIKDNEVGVGSTADHTSGSTFLRNDFIGNALHVDDTHGNLYYDAESHEGNHWSGHGCADWDRDWICDTHFIWGFAIDVYPLMFPAVWRGPPGGQWPVADPGGPYFGVVGKPITFHGEGSYDPDGEIATYHWEFGDGDTGEGPNPLWAYWWPAEYSVLLVVWDDDYMWGMCNTTATITEGHNIAHLPESTGPVIGIPIPLPGP